MRRFPWTHQLIVVAACLFLVLAWSMPAAAAEQAPVARASLARSPQSSYPAPHQALVQQAAPLFGTGVITGVVTSGSTPLPGIDVRGYVAGVEMYFTTTDADGLYEIDGLPAGSYVIGFEDAAGDYVAEFYSDQPTLALADEVPVADGETWSNINASLAVAAHIAGTVSNGTGPLAGIVVSAFAWDDTALAWVFANEALTGPTGAYDIGGLRQGDYRVEFLDIYGVYARVWYDGKATQATADTIPLEDGESRTGVDAVLTDGASISGVVSDTTNLPLELIYVEAQLFDTASGAWVYKGFDYTDEEGNFTIMGLAPGTVRLRYYDNTGQYATEFHDDAGSVEGGTDIILVAAAALDGYDAILAESAHIAGTVRADGGDPLKGIDVTAYYSNTVDSTWDNVGIVQTATDGAYDLGHLPAGTYRVGFVDGGGQYTAEFHNNVTTLDMATDLPLVAGETIAGIDATLLLAPTPTPTTTPTATVTVAPSVTPTATVTVAPSITPTETVTVEPSVTPTATITVAPSVTPTATVTVAPSVTPTATITVAPSVTPTATVSATPTPSVTPTPDSINVLPGQPASRTFDVGGGRSVRINVPTGAVTEPVTLLFGTSAGTHAAQPGWKLGKLFFSLTAVVNGVSQPHYTFAQPVEFEILYTDADIEGLDESALSLAFWDEDAGMWSTDGITTVAHNEAANRLVLSVTHLSAFGLANPGVAIFLPAVITQ